MKLPWYTQSPFYQCYALAREITMITVINVEPLIEINALSSEHTHKKNTEKNYLRVTSKVGN